MLCMMCWQDKSAIKAGTSKFTITFHKAACEGSYSVVKLTTEVGDMTSATALQMAAEMGRAECVDVLLEAGADADPRTSSDTTPLHQAAMNGYSGVVEMLLKNGADVYARDAEGTTPLGFALYKKQ